MTSEEYNKEQMEKGNLTDWHISELVKAWQRSNGLVVDGMCGPNTLRTFDPEEPASLFGHKILEVALEELGNGEIGGNNSGPHIARYKNIADDGDPDDDGAWCAAFLSWCAEEAASRLGVDMPFQKSQGAKRLFSNVAKGGGTYVENPGPGDFVCWDRGKKGSWQGHIGVVERVEDGILHTVEGNVGRFPSKVRRFMHDLTRQDRLEGFVRMPDVEEKGLS